MVERLGDMHANVATRGKFAADFFRADGALRTTSRRPLARMPLGRLLAEQCGLPAEEVREMEN
jgi:hypothetical protein